MPLFECDLCPKAHVFGISDQSYRADTVEHLGSGILVRFLSSWLNSLCKYCFIVLKIVYGEIFEDKNRANLVST